MSRLRSLLQGSGLKNLSLENAFILFSFLVIMIAWYALILAELGCFARGPLFTGISLIFILSVFGIPKVLWTEPGERSLVDYFALTAIVIFASLNVIFVHDTFGGEDPGVFANAAAYLVNHHSLVVNDRFINFPGWVQIENSFQLNFLPSYVSWLAVSFSIGGIRGIQLNNSLCLFMSLMNLYFIGKRLMNPQTGISLVLMVATTYPMFWFPRKTFNEIFFMALIWFGVLCFLIGYEERKDKWFFLSVLSIGLSSYTRIEGIAILGMFVLVAVMLRFVLRKKWAVSPKLAILIIIISGPFFLYATYARPFLSNAYPEILSCVSPYLSIAAGSISVPNPSALRYHFPDFVFSALSKYNLLWPILFIPLIFLARLKSLRQAGQEKAPFILLLLTPSFLFLYIPFVTLYQPWFLKRYVDVIIPAGFLSTAIFVHERFSNRMCRMTIVSLVIIMNLVVSAPIIFYKEHNGMITQVEDLCRMFSKDDLILVDRYAAGNYKLADAMFFIFDRYSLWVGPPGDWCSIDKLQVDFTKFRNVYLVTSSESSTRGYLNSSFPEGSLKLVLERRIEYEELERTVDLFHWARGPQDVYDIDYSVVKSSIDVPRNIIRRSYLILVYKLNFNSSRTLNFGATSGGILTTSSSTLRFADNVSPAMTIYAIQCSFVGKSMAECLKNTEPA